MNHLSDSKYLIINHDLDLSDRKIMKVCRRYINQYAAEIKQHINLHRDSSDDENLKFNMDAVVTKYRKHLEENLQIDEELIANYVIKVSYSSVSISKSLAWTGYGDYIIDNLRKHTNPKRNVSIREVPRQTNDSYEYLGKYYEFKAGDTYIRM